MHGCEAPSVTDRTALSLSLSLFSGRSVRAGWRRHMRCRGCDRGCSEASLCASSRLSARVPFWARPSVCDANRPQASASWTASSRTRRLVWWRLTSSGPWASFVPRSAHVGRKAQQDTPFAGEAGHCRKGSTVVRTHERSSYSSRSARHSCPPMRICSVPPISAVRTKQ